jgi:hypothetical protein
MEANEYYKRIMELADLDVEAKTIAESRMILEELEEREAELKDLHLELKRDIRYVEASYIKRKGELNQIFNQNQDVLPKKRFGKKKESRVTVLKKLEKEKQEVLDPYYEVRAMAEQLLSEINDAKKPLQDFVIDKMGL